MQVVPVLLGSGEGVRKGNKAGGVMGRWCPHHPHQRSNEKGIGPPASTASRAWLLPCPQEGVEAAKGSCASLNQLWPAQNHSYQKWVFLRGCFFPFPSTCIPRWKSRHLFLHYHIASSSPGMPLWPVVSPPSGLELCSTPGNLTEVQMMLLDFLLPVAE